MRKIFLGTFLLLAGPVLAATFTLTAPGTSCQYDSIVYDALGNGTANCSKSTPVPPDPIPPTPGGCPAVPGLKVWSSFGPSGQGTEFASPVLQVNSWPVPAPAAVQTSTALPETPQELKLSWWISPCPGDETYPNSAAASVMGRGGVVYHPCIVGGGIESGGVKWNGVGATDFCKLPAGSKWYITMKYTGGTTACPVGGDGVKRCTITYSWW